MYPRSGADKPVALPQILSVKTPAAHRVIAVLFSTLLTVAPTVMTYDHIGRIFYGYARSKRAVCPLAVLGTAEYRILVQQPDSVEDVTRNAHITARQRIEFDTRLPVYRRRGMGHDKRYLPIATGLHLTGN